MRRIWQSFCFRSSGIVNRTADSRTIYGYQSFRRKANERYEDDVREQVKSRWKRKKIMKSFMTLLLGYEHEIHKKNQKRIRIGLRCLIIIPLIFLALLFWDRKLKNCILILWIVSLIYSGRIFNLCRMFWIINTGKI